MRVVFMGTPQFAVPSLDALTSRTNVVAVYTRPDAISGRGGATRPSPVAEAALALGISVRKSASLKDEGALAEIAGLAPDLVVVAAYGLILPPAFLGVAPLGVVNVHASLLPRWRGAAPVQRAILAGDDIVGVSIMRVEAGLDTGPFCLQRSMSADGCGAMTLTDALAVLGAEALADALPSIADGTAAWTPQDPSLVTYADKVSKDDVAISPLMAPRGAVRHVRASMPAAPCRITVAGRGITVLEARLPNPDDQAGLRSGQVAGNRAGVLLGFDGGAVLVTRLRPDGKSAMAAADWARGVRDLSGSNWDAAR